MLNSLAALFLTPACTGILTRPSPESVRRLTPARRTAQLFNASAY